MLGSHAVTLRARDSSGPLLLPAAAPCLRKPSFIIASTFFSFQHLDVWIFLGAIPSQQQANGFVVKNCRVRRE
jgi:hypothetical protein